MPIELRHRTYFAYLDVPADVRSKLRRRVFRGTLQTDSRSVAARRAAPKIAGWKAAIAVAREEPNHNDTKFWRDSLRRAKDDQQRAAIMEQIEMAAWDIGAIHVDNIGDRPSGDPEAHKFVAEAIGERVPTTEHLDEWMGSLQVKDKTARMRRVTIERLGEKFKVLQDISRKEVRRWVTELAAELKPATVQRMMTDCRTYWAYLATIEAVPEESAPFDRLGLKVKRSSWQPFEPGDVVKLLNGAMAGEDTGTGFTRRRLLRSGGASTSSCARCGTRFKANRISPCLLSAGLRPLHPQLQTSTQAPRTAAFDPKRTLDLDGLSRQPPIQSRPSVALRVETPHGRRTRPERARGNFGG